MILFAFFLSGAAALLYEILWVRILTLLCGHTSLAVSAVLAAFMAGLALGSRFGGRIVDRYAAGGLLRLYAGLEIAIAAGGLLSKPALSAAGAFLLHAGILNAPPALQAGAYFTMAFVILLLPATAMGATLPLLTKWAATKDDKVPDRPLALLYGVNTAGAVTGAAVGGFVLLPILGTTAALGAAAALNIICAAIAYHGGGGPLTTTDLPPKTRPKVMLRPALLLAATGAAAMICQVAWTRAFSLLLGSTTYAFTVMLATFLFGLSLGSLAFAKFRGPLGPTLARLSFPLTLISASVFAGLFFFESLTYAFLRMYVVTFMEPDLIFYIQFFLCAAVMAVPTFLMGAILPWVVAAVRPRARTIGEETGAYYAANTAGAIAGSAAAGLLLIPALGMEGSLLAAALIYVAAAFAAGWESPYATLRTAAVLALLLIGAWMRKPWDQGVLSSGIYLYAPFYHATDKMEYGRYRSALESDPVIFFKSGRNATVSVLETEWGSRYLRINGKTDASETGDMGTQLLIGHLPLLLHSGTPRRALAVGLGSGMTAGALATDPRIERIDVLEIEPVVSEAARLFQRVNHGVLDDPRLRLIHADARQFLAAPGDRYDIITSEPSNPWIAGVASLFTREAFSDVRDRLNEDGIYTQWFHSYFMAEDDFRMVLRTFADVFPHVMLFSNGEADYFLMGSRSPWKIEYSNIRRAFRDNETMRGDFDRLQSGLDDPFTLLARSFVLGDADFRKYAAGARLHTDDRTSLEFSAPRNFHTHESDAILKHIASAKSTLLPDGLTGLTPLPSHWAKIYAVVGEWAIKTEDLAGARKSFKKSIELDPLNARAWTGLGILRQAERNLKGARTAYIRAAAIDPEFPHSHTRLGVLEAERGNDKRALAYFKKTLALIPEDPMANISAARIYQRRGEKEKALALIRTTLVRPVTNEGLLRQIVELRRALLQSPT